MSPRKPVEAVILFRPRPAAIVKMVRDAAAESKNVSFGRHARDRLEQRGITDREAIKVLRSGELKGDVEAGSERGEWKCKIVAPIRGTREVGVITLVLVSGILFVKTVEWEDL